MDKTHTGAETHDPLIVELVKVLARAAAERDFAKIHKSEQRRSGKRRREYPPEHCRER